MSDRPRCDSASSSKSIVSGNGTDPLNLKHEAYNTELVGLELSSRQEVNCVNLYDKTCQLVGIIKDVGSITKARNSSTILLKGHIQTEEDIIPFVCWNETIALQEPYLKAGIKCLIENIYVKEFNRDYDKTVTVGWQCNIMANTKITWISREEEVNMIAEIYKECTLEEVCKTGGLVDLTDVYIRSVPSLFQQAQQDAIRICSITDGRLSFEVRFGCEVLDKFEKGDPVTVKGVVNETGNPPYVLIKKPEHFCVKKNGQKLPLLQTIKASQPVKRRSEFDLELNAVKKPK